MTFSDLSRAWRGPEHSTARGALLLVHGFTGSPQSLRPWGEHHAERGWDVSIPLLPGHATTWQDMAHRSWQEWAGAVHEEAERLRSRYGSLSVGALSMGGALALELAADDDLGPSIDALVLVNPAVLLPRTTALALPVLSRLVPSVAGVASDIAAPGVQEEGYERSPVAAAEQMRRLQRRVRSRLDRVRSPLLLATSPEDHVVPPASSDAVAAGIAGPVERLALTRSFHVATLDHDAPMLFERSAAFLAEHARRG